MKSLVCLAAILVATLGCNDSPRSQQNVRQETAAATRTVISDVKGAAQGLKDGVQSEIHKPAAVNINTASRPALETLPGITPALSGQIVAHRPYASPDGLRKRRILTKEEYSAISGRITTN